MCVWLTSTSLEIYKFMTCKHQRKNGISYITNNYCSRLSKFGSISQNEYIHNEYYLFLTEISASQHKIRWGFWVILGQNFHNVCGWLEPFKWLGVGSNFSICVLIDKSHYSTCKQSSILLTSRSSACLHSFAVWQIFC